MRTSQIAAVVVWYHPTEEQRQLVACYQNAVGHVYVIDNTEDNRGIATALNIGIRQAIADGYSWILTLDQDSHMNAELLRCLVEESGEYPDAECVGIFSVHQDTEWHRKERPRYSEEIAVMCSGNLVRAQAFLDVNGMRDDFFIDLVDDDFCQRLHSAGWKVVKCNRVVMEHTLGNGYKLSPILHKPFIDHPVIRYYYYTRNTLYVIHDYTENRKYYKRKLFKLVKRLLIYDFIEKKRKIKAVLKGIKDYRHHVTGPLEETFISSKL